MLHHYDLLEQLHIMHKHQMENLLVYMVVQPTPYKSIYKLFLWAILVHCRKNSICQWVKCESV